LNNANGVNPKILDLERSGNKDGVTESLWQIVKLNVLLACVNIMSVCTEFAALFDFPPAVAERDVPPCSCVVSVKKTQLCIRLVPDIDDSRWQPLVPFRCVPRLVVMSLIAYS
jgi:hypothetical protein